MSILFPYINIVSFSVIYEYYIHIIISLHPLPSGRLQRRPGGHREQHGVNNIINAVNNIINAVNNIINDANIINAVNDIINAVNNIITALIIH